MRAFIDILKEASKVIPISEDVSTDLHHDELADNVYLKLYSYIHDGGKLEKIEINDLPGLGIDLSKIKDINDCFNDVLVVFQKANDESAGTQVLKIPQEGFHVIVTFFVKELTNSAIQSFLARNSYMVIHEMIHVLDVKRIGKTPNEINYKGTEHGNAEYFNHPLELNAYFHNLAEPLLVRINMIKKEGSEIVGLFDEKEIPRDFKEYLKKRIKRMDIRSGLWKNLDEKNRQRYASRLYALFQEYWKLINRD